MDLAHAPLDKRLRTLKASLRKLYLAGPDRPIARRNARHRVLSAMRLLRATVDECFPAIVERSEPRARKTGRKRFEHLKKTGWVEVTPQIATAFAAAGVTIRYVTWEEEKVVTRGWPLKRVVEKINQRVALVPKWANAIGADKPTALRAAKKSITLRKAALSVEGLR